jgi:hypothetical protein
VAYNENTKKSVMWFRYDNRNYGLAHQEVAVCDSAPGPNTFLTHFKPNAHQSRGIGMFPDADGKVYIGYAAVLIIRKNLKFGFNFDIKRQ